MPVRWPLTGTKALRTPSTRQLARPPPFLCTRMAEVISRCWWVSQDNPGKGAKLLQPTRSQPSWASSWQSCRNTKPNVQTVGYLWCYHCIRTTQTVLQDTKWTNSNKKQTLLTQTKPNFNCNPCSKRTPHTHEPTSHNWTSPFLQSEISKLSFSGPCMGTQLLCHPVLCRPIRRAWWGDVRTLLISFQESCDWTWWHVIDWIS